MNNAEKQYCLGCAIDIAVIAGLITALVWMLPAEAQEFTPAQCRAIGVEVADADQ